MALKGTDGGRYSFESKELITEIKRDIAEVGKDFIFAVWLRKYPRYGVEFIVNYDFIIEDDPLGEFDKEENERIVLMSGEKALDYLQKQSKPIEVFDIEI